MNTLVYKNENIEFKYDPDRKELYQKWDGFIKSSTFRDAIDELVNLADKYEIYYIVSDTTTTALAPKDNDYASRVMSPLFGKGVKFMAFLMSEQSLTNMAVSRFTKANKSEINIGHFANLDEAQKWVEENRF